MRGDRKIWRNGLVSKKVDMSKRGAPVDSQDFDVQNLVNVKQKGQHEISKNISELNLILILFLIMTVSFI